jgi:hypothetical protein
MSSCMNWSTVAVRYIHDAHLLRFYYVYINTNNDMRNKQLHVTEQGSKGQIRNVKKYGKYLNQLLRQTRQAM